MIFPLRVVSTALGVIWFCGLVVLIATPGMNANGFAQPSPSGSASGSPSPSPTSTTTTTSPPHGDPRPALSQIEHPIHRSKVRAKKLDFFRGKATESGATIRLALVSRTKSGDCFWRHKRRWVADDCKRIRRHLVFVADGSNRWSYEVPWKLRPSDGNVRFYTLFSFAEWQGSPFSESFESGRNRNRFDVRR